MTVVPDRISMVVAADTVPEYWIIDLISHTVEVLTLEFGEYHPIGVFQGKATLPSRVLPGFPACFEQFFM